jgi:two-component system response regulator HydG
MKVLVVDDEIEICQRLQRELRKEGHKVDYRTSPLNVLKELKQARKDGEPYNLLLLNIRMPGMDGLTLFSRIREERLGVEVIIVSGYREEQTVIEAIRLSARNYLNKPVSLEELDAALSHVYNKSVEEAYANRRYRILVVDDEQDLCRRIKRELDKEGYQTAVAYTAGECIDYFKKNKVDVLIADIKMPGISGLEMLERCREITDDFVSIVITGHGDYETAKKALSLHAYDYLKKPMSLDELITSVKKGIERLNALRGISALKEER